MRTDTPKTIYLKDYKPYPFKIESLDLSFDIHDGETVVTAKSVFSATGSDLQVYLNGEDLALLSLEIDGLPFDAYTKDEVSLSFIAPSSKFTLEVKTKIVPEKNTRLEGLYMSGGNYCTQCEAEGFRRITYWPDRPDVLSVYTVRVEADKKFPVLLSNGNKTSGGKATSGRHFTVWHDPFPKPCYLFALVAGDLEMVHDTYTTGSGKKVDLYIYVRKGDESQCDHAMQSLKHSMKWDEDTYGLEYDLDLFNIVAVSDFNMGAMENKSLNIFNTALVLAHQDTATDTDFGRVESVIAHEYFHNWSGNRVTCRDWFQLSLKEGLTVFRDQEFSADMNSRAVQRIDDVTQLRRLQFPEDAGPLAHPIRPDNYIEINNFYTMTVYEKGAEVIRMMRTILGPVNYRKGTDLYFSRHDGQAATCDDFIACMQEASGVDLSQFRLWYSQAGTPELGFNGEYNEGKKTYTVTLSQSTAPTHGQNEKKSLHIPVSIALLKADGTGSVAEEILHLTKDKEVFEFKAISEKPVASVLRNFSAPVNLKTDVSDADLAFLMLNDDDGFNKWEASQQLSTRVLLKAYASVQNIENGYVDAIGGLIAQALEPKADKALMARSLSLPAVGILEQQVQEANPPLFHEVRQALSQQIKKSHKEPLGELYAVNAPAGAFSVSAEAMGQRALRNTVLVLLTSNYGSGCAERAKTHYDGATNMTDRVVALGALTHMQNEAREACFEHFYEKFKGFPLVVDKWFSLQASSSRPDIIQNLKKLREHPDFNIKNPNRVRALYSAFAMNNPVAFHAADGSGYQFLTDAVIELNDINPQIAARLLGPMRAWRSYSKDRQGMMQDCLKHILAQPDLAPDVFEIASKSVNA
jgi:aminopeptidase N